jgi:hypothetical protein
MRIHADPDLDPDLKHLLYTYGIVIVGTRTSGEIKSYGTLPFWVNLRPDKLNFPEKRHMDSGSENHDLSPPAEPVPKLHPCLSFQYRRNVNVRYVMYRTGIQCACLCSWLRIRLRPDPQLVCLPDPVLDPSGSVFSYNVVRYCIKKKKT